MGLFVLMMQIADYKNNVLILNYYINCEKNNNVIHLTMNINIKEYLYLFSE